MLKLSFRHKTCLFAMTLVTCAVSQALYAAEREADDMRNIERIVITASAEPGTDIGLKIPAKISEIPQSITIIDEDRLSAQGLITLDDVMLQAPGITIQPGVQLRTAYYSRGFAISSMSFDGIPTSGWNEAINTEDMAIYERVEVLRGASGLLQGVGDPAGTINLVRKRPTESLLVKGELVAGSDSNYRVQADVGGGLNEDGSLRARAISVYENKDYFYDEGARDKALFYGTTEWNITPDTVLALTAKYQDTKDSGVMIGGLPRNSDGTSIGVSRSANTGTRWSERNWQNGQYFIELKHYFNDSWHGKISLSHIDGDSDLSYASLYGGIDKLSGDGAMLINGAYDFDNKETDLDAYITGEYELFGIANHLVAGVNYWDADVEQISYALRGVNGDTNIYRYDASAITAPTSKTRTGEQLTNTRQYGGYFANRTSLGADLTVILGGRLSWWDTEVNRRANIGGPLSPLGEYDIDAEFTPYGGVVYAINDQVSAYSSYTAIFNPQSYRDASGEILDPMTGYNYEAGLKGSFYQGKLYSALSLFNIKQEDRAQVDPNVPCTGGTDCVYIADGEVESKGVDIELSGSLTDNLKLQLGYTWLDTEYVRDRDATGNATANEGHPYASFTPRHMLKLWTHYTPAYFDQALSLGAGFNIQSSQYVESNGMRLNQGGYAVFDADMHYTINEQWQVSLNVKNLFDKTYYSRIGSVGWNNWYGEPRSIQLTLRAQY